MKSINHHLHWVHKNEHVILCVAAVFYFFVIGYAIPRGFDFSDEGLYVGIANPFQSNKFGVLNYDLFFKFLFQVFSYEFGIIELRILRLISYGLAAFYLVKCFHFEQKAPGRQWTLGVFAFLILCSGYAFLPMSFSYNSMTVVVGSVYLSLFVGFFLKKKENLKLSLGMGICIAILFYFKITVAAALFGLTVILILMSKIKKTGYLSVLVLPIFACEMIFWFVLQDCASIRLAEGIEVLQHREGYSLGRLLKTNLVGLFWVLITVSSGWFFGLATRIKNLYMKIIILGILVIGVVGVTYMTSITVESVYSFMMLSIFLMGFLFQKHYYFIKSREKRVLILILFFFPFLLHFGSNVYFLRNGIHYAFSWVIMLVLLVEDQERSSLLRVGMVIALFPFLVDGLWLRPFEQKSIWHQNIKYNYRNNKSIYLDIDQYNVLEAVKDVISKLEPKQEEILPIYANPGIPYLLGYHLPYSPGIWDYEYLKALYRDHIAAPLVLVNDRDKFPSKHLDRHLQYESPVLLEHGLRIFIREGYKKELD